MAALDHRVASLITTSRLQLALQLVEKNPIGAVGDNFVGIRFNQTGLVQLQSVESDAILGI